LWIRFENLHAANADALDDLGRPHAVNEAVARINGKLSQLSRELGLLPVAEKALRLDAATQANHSMWLALANYKNDEEVVPARPRQSARRQPLPRTARLTELLSESFLPARRRVGHGRVLRFGRRRGASLGHAAAAKGKTCKKEQATCKIRLER
jgi:hypothetical protein